MRSFKKFVCFMVAISLIVAMCTGCSGAASGATAGSGKLKVVTTIFPEYDWVKEITAGVDSVDITLLMDTGADLHSYQPTAEDIMKVGTADVFIYVGGESDGWVDDALKNAVNKDMTVINLMDVLKESVKEEEVVEGMQEEEHEDADEDHEQTHGDAEEEVEYDEHVWLSLKNAKVVVSSIAESLSAKDSANSQKYTANADAYIAKLDTLDQEYQKAVDEGSFDTLLFGDRFPFRYMVDDYDIRYFAAFVGCSAETEASFETIKFLADKVDELGLTHVLTTEKTDGKIAKTIIDTAKASDVKVLAMDSMQSVTITEVEGGETYYSIMEKNLDVLKQALK
ncbi:MAG: zinc ABC transporter substrate-binding protein [Eubacterium sp.]|nr:zinc ABC transporter substrate-binding protein [Eubacterium sp.]